MKQRLIPFFIVLLSFNVSAQTAKNILKNVYVQYSSPSSLSFETSYKLYKTFDTNVVYQSYEGLFYKSETNEVYIKINETEILNNKQASLKVSHPEKMVLVSNPELTISEDLDVSKLLDFYKEESTRDMGSYWELELLANQPTLPYTKIVLHITKNHLLKKQIFFYGNEINFSNDFRKPNNSNPRLEVSYANYSDTPINKNKFSTSSFLEIERSGTIVLSDKIKDYEVLDKRQGLN